MCRSLGVSAWPYSHVMANPHYYAAHARTLPSTKEEGEADTSSTETSREGEELLSAETDASAVQTSKHGGRGVYSEEDDEDKERALLCKLLESSRHVWADWACGTREAGETEGGGAWGAREEGGGWWLVRPLDAESRHVASSRA